MLASNNTFSKFEQELKIEFNVDQQSTFVTICDNATGVIANENSKKESTPMINEISDREEFLKNLSELTQELDNLEIHWPGDAVKLFNDDDALKKFMEHQYPDWKKSGQTTSTPCVRIPQIIIPNKQLGKKLQIHYRNLERGDIGESKLYKLFVNEVSTDDSGIIIFPNVDGSHIFRQKGPGSVEIDMLIAHPRKGIFVFNVKNEKKLNFRKLQSHIKKHTDFVRFLLCYNINSKESLDSVINEVPIHAVLCYPPGKKESIQKYLSDRVFVFDQSHFKKFAQHWKETLKDIRDMRQTEKFDTLVARLVALNSKKGASTEIHQKFLNDIQSIRVNTSELEPWLEKQIENLPENDPCKKSLIEAEKTIYNQSKNKKTTVILWTKEQLEVICRVFKGIILQSNDSNKYKSLQINVRGTKGSGKTMLMIYLARLINGNIIQTGRTDSKVVIFDGSCFGAAILFLQLKQTLYRSGIEFWTVEDFFEKIDDIGKGIVFIDEDPLNYPKMQNLLLFLHIKGVSFCIFSSEEPVFTALGLHKIAFTEFILSHTLRSTKQLQCFSRNCVKSTNSSMDFREIFGEPSHNLDGTNVPEIILTHDSTMEPFYEKSVQTVMKYAAFSKTISSILVIINFLSPKSQMAIISLLRKEKNALRSFTYEIVLDDNDEKLPIIQLESTDSVCGSEFGTVVVLLEKMVDLSSEEFGRKFRVAVTRATTYLAIVVAGTTFFDSPLQEEEILGATRTL